MHRATLIAVLLTATAAGARAQGNVTDDEIANAVATQLDVNQAVPSHLIDVSATEGMVTLMGSVDSILAKEHATRIAQMTSGVRTVTNQLVVTPVQRTDEKIQSDVRDALAGPATEACDVNHSVIRGMVTLTGSVPTWQDQQLCANTILGVAGIVEVRNEITIETAQSRPDTEIEPEIESRLAFISQIDEPRIDVTVQTGDVRLAGAVASAYEIRLAHAAAWVRGVNAVDIQELAVRTPARGEASRAKTSAPTNDALQQALENAFLYNPRLRPFSISTSVENGRVTLSGNVDNLKAKRAAEAEALNTVGVWHIDNRLKVRPTSTVTSGELVDRVERSLARDPYLDRYEITVYARIGRVNLYGTVDSVFEKFHAEDVAARVAGVVELYNGLTVLGSVQPQLNDEAIRQNIQSELAWNPYVDETKVSIKVDDGLATLTGIVNSWPERIAAVENAFEGQARSVRNNLQIEGYDHNFNALCDFWWYPAPAFPY